MLVRLVKSILIPKETRELGRWALKHQPRDCEKYMYYLHADPGYQNPFKKIIPANKNATPK